MVPGARDRAREVRGRRPGHPAAPGFAGAGVEGLGLSAAIVGHAGDGNLHINVLVDASEIGLSEELVHNVVDDALARGGTCTGEHGVGLGKREALLAQSGEAAVETMRAPLLAAHAATIVPRVPESDAGSAEKAVATSATCYRQWSRTPVAQRAAMLRHAADAFTPVSLSFDDIRAADVPGFIALLFEPERPPVAPPAPQWARGAGQSRQPGARAAPLQRPVAQPAPSPAAPPLASPARTTRRSCSCRTSLA